MSDEIIPLEIEPSVKEGRVTNVVLDSQLLTSIMSCARKADYTFNQNWRSKKGKSNSLECGSIAHTILEFYNKSLASGKNRDEAIAIGYEAGQEYIKGYSETNKYVTNPEDVGLKNTPLEPYDGMPNWTITVEQVLKTMEQYFDYYRNDMWSIVSVEDVRGRLIYADDDIRILWKAKYDLVVDTNGGIMSVDHKTMKQRKDTILLNNQFIGQCAILHSRNVIVNKIGWQKTVAPKEKFTRPVLSYSPDIIAEWVNETVPFWARMWVAFNEAGHFPPNHTSCSNEYGPCVFYEDVCKNRSESVV